MALINLSNPLPASPHPLPARTVRAPAAVLLIRPANPVASRRRHSLRSACVQRRPAAGALSARCGVTVIDQTRFKEEVLDSDSVVLVEFVASWCGPCRLITPIVDWAAQEYKGSLKVVKIDHDENPQLIEEYKVYGLPTLILFKNGQEIPGSKWEGAMTKVKLKEYLDSFLQSATIA